MTTRNISENGSENKSARIHYLEQQVRMMHNELQQIRKGMVPQIDHRRFRNLSDKLNELNALLYELRINFRRLQQPRSSKQDETLLRNNNNWQHDDKLSQQQRRRFGQDRHFLPRHQIFGAEKEDETVQDYHGTPQYRQVEVKHSQSRQQREFEIYQSRAKSFLHLSDQQKPKDTEEYTQEPRTENKQRVSVELDTSKAPIKSCQQLMGEMRSPGSILGNYLVRLQDFRADPELRRRRLEKKREEKFMQQQQKHENEKEMKISDERNETINYSSKESLLDNSPQNHLHKTTTQQAETSNEKCRIIEWDNTPIPPEPPRPPPRRPLLTETPNEMLQTTEEMPDAQADVNEIPHLDVTTNGEAYEKKPYPQDSNSEFTPTTQPSSISDSDSSCPSSNLPLVNKNLKDVVNSIVQNIDPDIVALTVVLETDNLYHINISVTTTGRTLSCLYATEAAIQEAKTQNLFKKFLTFFVVDSDNTLDQKDAILRHSFEFKRE